MSRHAWIIFDTRFDHANMCECCGRPESFNLLITKYWKRIIAPDGGNKLGNRE